MNTSLPAPDALDAHHERLAAIAADGRSAQRREVLRAVFGAAVAVAVAFGGIAMACGSMQSDRASVSALEREIASMEGEARRAAARAEASRRALDAMRAAPVDVAPAVAPVVHTAPHGAQTPVASSRPRVSVHRPTVNQEPAIDLESGPDPFALDDTAPARR